MNKVSDIKSVSPSGIEVGSGGRSRGGSRGVDEIECRGGLGGRSGGGSLVTDEVISPGRSVRGRTRGVPSVRRGGQVLRVGDRLLGAVLNPVGDDKVAGVGSVVNDVDNFTRVSINTGQEP